MKVLASRYREAQVDWYAKCGTTILGFELHFTDKNKERKVLYFLFVSDDTYQDSLAVLCAKHFMYTEVLPLFGIKQEVSFPSRWSIVFQLKRCQGIHESVGLFSW